MWIIPRRLLVLVQSDSLNKLDMMPQNYKNSSGDEIANVNFFYNDMAHVLQNNKKELTSFNKLDDS